MNILMLTSVYPQSDDNRIGITRTVQYFCEQWAEAGHKVIVIHNNSCFPLLYYIVPNKIREKKESVAGHTFPSKTSRKELAYIMRDVSIYRFPMKKIIPHSAFPKKTINSQVIKIVETLNKEQFKPDIILSHWVNPQFELILKLKKIYETKISLVFHGDCSEENIKKFDLINKIQEFDAVGCRNDSYAEFVMKKLKLDHKPFICYSGIPDQYAEDQIKKLNQVELCTSLEFIYVGRLVKYKNVDTIIKALYKKYGNRKYRLHIVGSGAERENLEELAKALKCEKNICFHGQLDRSEIFELLKKCYCFIMVSDNETFGMVYIEAMLAGCITIASKNGGVDGVIFDGENGYLSKQGDVEELIKTLNRIEENENIDVLRKKAIQTAYEYKDSKIAQRYLEDVINWKNIGV